jgi:hypothetical protein
MIPERAAWAAGFLDGEGHFGIQRLTSLGRTTYRPVIVCTQTNLEALEILQVQFGGWLGIRKISGLSKQHAWEWRIQSSRSIIALLDQLEPYFVVKRDQGKVLYDFCLRIQTDRAGKPKLLTDEEIAMREALCLKLASLKRAS